ncbi:hypothetical protein IIV30_065L [Invertebrate iridescent virus 30]|uniref:Uncharacterized protein n=1 Tax=Invertebrate iridescent virus 30 TaxID=345585 RepID=W8W2I4_9VIRU|nr:hypothetical protein IIV30_065L [Invertebrate iridescent virus 30]CCV02260.1 hypothetical protein IIV30_065L [Invertebrate iridescent virus 30]
MMRIVIGLLLLIVICNSSCPRYYDEITSYSGNEQNSAAIECNNNCRNTCISTIPPGKRFMGYTCVPDYLPGDTMMGRFYDCCCKYGNLQYCYNC